jgi:hypothetical protein
MIPYNRKLKKKQLDISIYSEVTHSELLELISSSSLEEGSFYLITDFQTIHLIPTTTDIHYGEVEPILTQAISNSEVGSDVTSLIYPKDEIKVDLYDVVCEDNSTPRKGRILYRKDNVNNVSAFIDWRNVVYRRRRLVSSLKTPITKVNDTTLALTIAGNTPAFTSYFKYEVTIPSLTHNAGNISLQVTYNNGTTTKPIYRYNKQGVALNANELSGLSGPLVWSRSLDAFVLMDFAETGITLQGAYAAYGSGATFSVGYGKSWSVDINDYVDYKMFNGSLNRDVEIGMFGTGSIADSNTVFRSSLENVRFRGGTTNCTFSVLEPNYTKNNFTADTWVIECLSEHSFEHSHFKGRIQQMHFRLMNASARRNLRLLSNAFGCTIRVPWETVFNAYIEASDIFFQDGSIANISGGVFHSGVFLVANALGASTHAGTQLRKQVYRGLVGFFNSTHYSLDREVHNTSFIETKSPNTRVNRLAADNLNITTLPAASGSVTNIGIDENGDVVQASEGTTTGAGPGLSQVGDDIQLGDNNNVYFTPNEHLDFYFESGDGNDYIDEIAGIISGNPRKSVYVTTSNAFAESRGVAQSTRGDYDIYTGTDDTDNGSFTNFTNQSIVNGAATTRIATQRNFIDGGFRTNLTQFSVIADVTSSRITLNANAEAGDVLINIVASSTPANSGIFLIDSVNNKGAVYGGDYEDNFVPRSLVTVQWVEDYVAANGGGGSPDLSNYVTLDGNETITGLKTFSNKSIVQVTGNQSTFFGLGTGTTSDTGANRFGTAFGYEAANKVTTAGSFVAVGRRAGFNATTASGWVAIGQEAGRDSNGNSFIAIGSGAGRACVGGGWTAIGSSAGRDNVNGTDWIAIGTSSSMLNTGAGTFVSIGVGASQNATTATQYVSIGWNAASNMTSGTEITAIGTQAGRTINTGGGWTSVGSNAGRYLSGGLTNATSTSNSVYIGRNTKVASNGVTNEIVIGNDTEGIGSNTVVIGNTSIVSTVLRGQLTVGTVNNGTGDFITISGSGVLTRRTAAQVFDDIGAGSGPSYTQGTGITISGDVISLNTTFTDDRYVNRTGDTLTGVLNGTVFNDSTGRVPSVLNASPIGTTNFWTGTQAEYNALGSYSNNVIYFID